MKSRSKSKVEKDIMKILPKGSRLRKVMFDENLEIWGGPVLDSSELTWTVILNLCAATPNLGMSSVKFPPKMNKDRFMATMAILSQSEPLVISVDWKDGGIPHLQAEFWKALAKDLLKENGRILVCCQGGIGRTGTALAILLSHLCPPSKGKSKDPVARIRAIYRSDAVETDEQVDYIEAMTGLRSRETGSLKSWYGHGHNDSRFISSTTTSTPSTKTPPPPRVCHVSLGGGRVEEVVVVIDDSKAPSLTCCRMPRWTASHGNPAGADLFSVPRRDVLAMEVKKDAPSVTPVKSQGETPALGAKFGSAENANIDVVRLLYLGWTLWEDVVEKEIFLQPQDGGQTKEGRITVSWKTLLDCLDAGLLKENKEWTLHSGDMAEYRLAKRFSTLKDTLDWAQQELWNLDLLTESQRMFK